ncbi:diguanylate cyclase [Aneurinibacillus soli]|uniref:Putative diguanylate cyclase YdaM n=1 Tax=Aneurinibacillus soli TaxID=1500254 RepID=A0A0U5BFR0_9BACL|nr:diguanylate cyclase [Aneurinibacillus soli]PYE60640.1 diguanylate cyclase [Aneurinibacillus soli]BAU29836.1 putative diguanylate cyclase YdaM [Aneurinibacillus soli]
MIQSVLSNIAVILIMHACLNFMVTFLKDKVSKGVFYSLVVFIISFTSISMFYLPIEYKGYRLDLRVIPLGFAALFIGWREVLPALAIVCMWRWGMGGAGAVPGIVFGLLLPTIFVLLFYIGNTTKVQLFKVWALFSVMWLISDLPIIIWIPNGWEVFMMIAPFRYISLMSSAVILYLFVIWSTRQIELQHKLKFFAEHDPLTEMYNLRKFFDLLEVEYKKKKTVNYLALVDLDYFKKINDTYGHLTGDRVLQKMAKVFLQTCKTINSEGQRAFVARYGGEEFILYVSCTSVEYLESCLEHIREAVAAAEFWAEDGSRIPSVTLSIGCAELTSIENVQQTLLYADQSLYEVKNSGRNGVKIYKEE